ncbi:hypothetical protein RB195_023304 [Necator americanus]|uniref:Reverse transcriptase domain-containing protein n=1 Tax=Necator americanus TaxID=51031 RepID=A0ABR1EIL8_NECAM
MFVHRYQNDDIVLITSRINEAERMLINFDEACGCIGLELNLQKTMFMRNAWVSDTLFALNGTNISECTSYVHLAGSPQAGDSSGAQENEKQCYPLDR